MSWSASFADPGPAAGSFGAPRQSVPAVACDQAGVQDAGLGGEHWLLASAASFAIGAMLLFTMVLTDFSAMMTGAL